MAGPLRVRSGRSYWPTRRKEGSHTTINRSDLLLVSQGQNVTVGVGELLDAAASESSGVTSVNGQTGDVTLSAADAVATLAAKVNALLTSLRASGVLGS